MLRINGCSHSSLAAWLSAAVGAVAAAGMLVAIGASPAYARAQNPTPPAAVLTEARRVGKLMGVTLPQEDPGGVSARTARHTGHTLWELDWGDVSVTVDGTTVQGVGYRDDGAFRAASDANDQGTAIAVTLAQAQATFGTLRTTLAVPAGDWRDQTSELTRYGANLGGSTGLPMYKFAVRRYVSDKPVKLGLFFATVEPFTGKVTRWTLEDCATFSTPQGALLTAAQAQQAAQAAFLQYAGPSLVPGDPTTPAASGGGAWEPLSDATTLSRIAHRFIFPLAEIPDPDDVDNVLRPQVELWVDIDAETGEVTFIGNVLAGAPLNKVGKHPISDRVLLMHRLAAARAPEPLVAAVAGGTPLPDGTAAQGAKNGKAKATVTFHSFRIKAGGEVQEFRHDTAGRRLLWKAGASGGKGNLEAAWRTLQLTEKLSQALERWERSRAGSNGSTQARPAVTDNTP